MNTAFLKTRQTKYGGYLALYLLLVLAVLGAANFLANRYNKTKDLTASKLFSLSDQTKKVVGNLNTDVKMYYFDRSDAWTNSRFGPSPKDLLTRYSNLSPKLKVEYVDPVRNNKRALEMKVTNFGTLYIEALGRREESKGLQEEQVTNALIRVLKPEKRSACFLTGHGEHDLENTQGEGFSALKDALEGNNFITKTVSLLEKEPSVPSDCTVMIVGGPKKDLLEIETAAIKKYVQGGGRALFLVDPMIKNVDTKTVDKLLGEWGVSVNDDLVVDLSGIGKLYGMDEFSPLVTKYESHIITRDLRNTATLFPLARSVTVGSGKGDVTAEKLFATSTRSFAVKDFKSGKQIEIDPKKDTAGPVNLGVAGVYNAPPAATPDAPKSASGRFVVMGGSLFATNSTLGFPGGNRDLVLNAMDWLINEEDLIAIRPKDVEDRRLSMSEAQMSRILITNVFGLPLLIIGVGVWSWWKRR